MCGRFTLTWDEWRRVVEALKIDDDSDMATSYRPHFNIAPTDQHFIVTSEFERQKGATRTVEFGQSARNRQPAR